MQKILPYIILTVSLFLLNSCFKANDHIEHYGKCTGSAYCSACSNCSRCGYCSSGGTCGVCSGSSSGNRSFSGNISKKSNTKKHRTSESYKSQKTRVHSINESSDKMYNAGASKIYIYEKPSLKSKIIAIVPKRTQLIRLSKTKPWYRVQVKKGGKTGYIYSDDLN